MGVPAHPTCGLLLWVLFTITKEIRRIEFSFEPIVYTGLDSAAAGPAAVLQGDVARGEQPLTVAVA